MTEFATAAVTSNTADDISAAVARLDALGMLAVNEHVAVYDQVHASLRDTLASLDDS